VKISEFSNLKQNTK